MTDIENKHWQIQINLYFVILFIPSVCNSFVMNPTNTETTEDAELSSLHYTRWIEDETVGLNFIIPDSRES